MDNRESLDRPSVEIAQPVSAVDGHLPYHPNRESIAPDGYQQQLPSGPANESSGAVNAVLQSDVYQTTSSVFLAAWH